MSALRSVGKVSALNTPADVARAVDNAIEEARARTGIAEAEAQQERLKQQRVEKMATIKRLETEIASRRSLAEIDNDSLDRRAVALLAGEPVDVDSARRPVRAHEVVSEALGKARDELAVIVRAIQHHHGVVERERNKMVVLAREALAPLQRTLAARIHAPLVELTEALQLVQAGAERVAQLGVTSYAWPLPGLPAARLDAQGSQAQALVNAMRAARLLDEPEAARVAG
jgi:hypothetical protein